MATVYGATIYGKKFPWDHAVGMFAHAITEEVADPDGKRPTLDLNGCIVSVEKMLTTQQPFLALCGNIPADPKRLPAFTDDEIFIVHCMEVKLLFERWYEMGDNGARLLVVLLDPAVNRRPSTLRQLDRDEPAFLFWRTDEGGFEITCRNPDGRQNAYPI